MTGSEGRRIAAYYDRLVDRYGHDPRACDYGSAASQAAKYRVLADVAPLEGRSVLDVGCGFADYADFLEARFPKVQYTGIDLSRRMTEEARRRRPDLEIVHASILDWSDARRFDVVSANGIFYLLGRDAPALMRDLIARMYRLCDHAIAFNSLSTWASVHEPGEFYAEPREILEYCHTIAPWVTLRHDYLPHDFTVYLYRERPGA